MTVNRQWILKQRPEGLPRPADFELKEAPLPELGDKGMLVKTLYLSFDPTQASWAKMDTYIPAVPLGEPMRAFGVGEVVESTSDQFKKGDLVFGMTGWQGYAHFTIGDPAFMPPTLLPSEADPAVSLALFLTGQTAYFGLSKIGKPKVGETVLVSGAAGATGSIAAQIAKIKGARVIGIAGGPEKCKWLSEMLHLDGTIDYKTEDVLARLPELCPNGVDVYFDNVGGPILDAALQNLAMGARIVICGGISQYDKFGSLDAYGGHRDRGCAGQGAPAGQHATGADAGPHHADHGGSSRSLAAEWLRRFRQPRRSDEELITLVL